MYHISTDADAMNVLRRKGFTEKEIAHLYPLRKTYGQNEMDQATIDRNHLEFARWLVRTGRLTEQITNQVHETASL